MNKIEITDKELIEKISKLAKDEMSIFVMADGRIRGALFHGTRFVNQMRTQHNLGILETLVLGQACLCGALMIPTMKGQEHISLKYDVDGPIEGFSIETDSQGYVRGYLYNEHIPVEKPLENWNLAPFLGKGTLTVSTLRKEDKEPHISSVEATNLNIAKDLAWYFNQSEQISTAFNTSIQFDKEGRVIGAGGMFLQVMPETGGTKSKGSSENTSSNKKVDEELIEKVEMAFNTSPSLGQWFSEGGNINDIVYGLFREFNPSVAVTRNVSYDCPCSKELFLSHLKNMPKQQLEQIKTEGNNAVELQCKNCGSTYTILLDELN